MLAKLSWKYILCIRHLLEPPKASKSLRVELPIFRQSLILLLLKQATQPKILLEQWGRRVDVVEYSHHSLVIYFSSAWQRLGNNLVFRRTTLATQVIKMSPPKLKLDTTMLIRRLYELTRGGCVRRWPTVSVTRLFVQWLAFFDHSMSSLCRADALHSSLTVESRDNVGYGPCKSPESFICPSQWLYSYGVWQTSTSDDSALNASAESALLSSFDNNPPPAYGAIDHDFYRQSGPKRQYPLVLQLLGLVLLGAAVYGFVRTVLIVEGTRWL